MSDLTDGLRALADFLDAHPDVPQPAYTVAVHSFARGTDDDKVAEVLRVAAMLGVEPTYPPEACGHVVAAKKFGPVVYQRCAITRSRAEQTAAWLTYAGQVSA